MKEDSIEKLKKDLDQKSKSLTEKMSDLKTKVANMKKFSNHVILCDVSGSMDAPIEGNTKAIDVVQSTIDNFKGAKIFEFSNGILFKKDGILNRPNGNTNMGGAFKSLKEVNGIKEIILLTDGAPDSEAYALNEAKGLKINIIYIGPQPTPLFLIKLAKATGGKFEDVELIKIGSTGAKELANKITLMLNV